MILRHAALALSIALASGCALSAEHRSPEALTIVSWNLEHLAENDNSGCRPRTEPDYAALRGFAAGLKADVIAFQEVESAKAAARVFDPNTYTIIIEQRPGTPDSKPPCNGAPELHLNRQAVGFAVRKGVAFTRSPDVTALQDGDPNLRSGVDITISRSGRPPLRLLAVHLKSGCAGVQSSNPSCDVLKRQAATLESWIEARAREPAQFAILGDFNRRLALPGDAIWATLDGPPGPTDLTLAGGTMPPSCDPRYTSFIDHIVLDPRAATNDAGFKEHVFSGARLSDHCPVSVSLTATD